MGIEPNVVNFFIMSRPSTCSTQGQSRKCSALTDSYDGDIESLSRAGSEVGNNSVYFNYNAPFSSPAFQMISDRIISSETSFPQESTPLFESESENETSTSNKSTVNYTDSDFCRVQRTADKGLVESLEITQCEQNCKSGTASCKSRIDTTDTLISLLNNAKLTAVEASNTSFSVDEHSSPQPELYELLKSPINSTQDRDGEVKAFWKEMKLAKIEDWQLTRQSVHSEERSANVSRSSSFMTSENCDSEAINSSEESYKEPELTEREIIQKQRDLRDSFKAIVKETRQTLKKVRAERSANEISPRRGKAVASKRRKERGKGLKNAVDSKESDSVLHDVSVVEGVWVGRRVQVSPISNKLLKQRKKQDALAPERRPVQDLIKELNNLDLHEQAANMESALAFKENQDKEFAILLEEERRNIKRRKNMEISRQKEEAKRKRLAEIRRSEAERQEREDTERKRRIEEAKKRRDKNRMLWESHNEILLANSITRSYTFSYFPKLRLQPIERPHTEPQKTTHSAKVRKAKEKHGEKCHQ